MRSIFVLMGVVLAVSPPDAFAQRHTLIALSHEAHTISELDPATGKVLQQFGALGAPGDAACKAVRQACEPHEAAISPDGRTLFVSVPAGPFVQILDATTFKEKGRVETDWFKRPAPPTGQPGANRGTSAWPHGIALNNDGSKLYVTSENAEVTGVIVYDVRAGKAVSKIDVKLKGGHYLQVQPRTDKLYFPHSDDNRVVVIDTKTDKITKVIPVTGGPVGIDFAPNGEVWVYGDDDGSITVIDSKRDEVVKVVQTGAKRGGGRIAVSPDGRYVASTGIDAGDVVIINGQTKQVTATIPLGKGQLTPLFSPDGTKLYVLNAEESLCTIDVKTSKLIARSKLNGPFGLGGGVRAHAN